MFDILTNETNLNPLRAAIANAEREILICSAWVRSETLWKLFDRKTLERTRAKGIKVRIIIRLGKLIDVKITDSGVFKWVEELVPSFSFICFPAHGGIENFFKKNW